MVWVKRYLLRCSQLAVHETKKYTQLSTSVNEVRQFMYFTFAEMKLRWPRVICDPKALRNLGRYFLFIYFSCAKKSERKICSYSLAKTVSTRELLLLSSEKLFPGNVCFLSESN